MATAQPFAYNLGPFISGTEQYGDLSVGTPTTGFTNAPQFWNGPDEDLGYVIAQPVSSGDQPNPVGIPAYVGFFRTDGFSDFEFINLTSSIANQVFTNTNDAYVWLNLNGYWTSYVPSGVQIMDLDASIPTSYSGGTTWFDLSGYGHNGTINGATFSSAYGGVFNFNGTSNFVALSQPLSGNTSYTISAWVKSTSNAGARNIVSSQNAPFWVSNGTLYAGVGGSYTEVAWNTVFPLNTWVYVTTSFSNQTNTMKLYVDGVLVDTNTNVTPTYTSENTFIGSHFNGSNVSFWQGSIGEVTIYNGAVTDSTVLIDYDNSKGRYVEPTPTPTVTQTPTVTPTNTSTPTPSITATQTQTPTNTTTPTTTLTSTPTNTPSVTQTSTPTNTPSVTQTSTPTNTPSVTQTSTPTNTPSVTQTSTPTNTTTSTNTPTPTITPSSNIATSGLLIALDAYSSSSYSGGTTVTNLQSPGTYNHTLNGATFTTLNSIKCFDVTTGSNRITVNGTGPILPSSGYTYITWAKLEPGIVSSFRTLWTTNSPKYTPITIPNNSNTLGYWDSAFRSSGYDLSGQTDIWVQYAVVGDSSSQSFYINGSQVGSTIAYGAGGTTTHWTWGNNEGANQPWGYVANMYFYNKKLSLAEITQTYNFLAPRFVEPTPTPTTTSTPTVTPTNTVTQTPTNTVTPTKTVTPTVTTTPTPSSTPVLTSISYLVVGGGAGGGANWGGGGGAGQVLTGTTTLSKNVTYTITVGSGGNGATGSAQGSNGGTTTFSGTGLSLSAIGGGGGGYNTSLTTATNGSSGASGGGGGGGGGARSTGGAGTVAFSGGSVTISNSGSGGGGGSTQVGANGTSPAGVGTGGNGGNGTTYNITGSNVVYAGGGGGGGDQGSVASTGGTGGGGNGGNTLSGAGANATGYGSGGGGGATVNGSGGRGSNGVVILSIPTSQLGTYTGSPIVGLNGANTILTFSGNGTYTAASTVPVTSNLVLSYDPSIASSYPGTGTTINDVSGNGLNGTLSNVTFATPFLTYNGSTSQVTRLDNALIEPGAGDWTMEVWVNQTDATGSQVALGKFAPGGISASVSYAIRVIGGNVRADFGNGITAVSTANYALTTGVTYQLVYVFNNVANDNIITYVNGVQQSTTTHTFASILNSTTSLYLGSYNGGEYPQYFNGKIGISRLYSSALTAAQVLQNFNASKSKYGL